jgi:hypothetical protein
MAPRTKNLPRANKRVVSLIRGYARTLARTDPDLINRYGGEVWYELSVLIDKYYDYQEEKYWKRERNHQRNRERKKKEDNKNVKKVA